MKYNLLQSQIFTATRILMAVLILISLDSACQSASSTPTLKSELTQAPVPEVTPLPAGTALSEPKTDVLPDGMITSENASQVEILHTLQRHKGRIVAIEFALDDSQLQSLASDFTFKRWDTNSGEELNSIKPKGGPIYNGAISPLGDVFAVEGPDHVIQLRASGEGQILQEMKRHSAFIMSFTFSLDGSLLATGDDKGSIMVWETTTGQLKHTLAGHRSPVGALAFSPDNTLLASGGVEGSNDIKLWELEGGTEKASYQNHTGNVYDLVFSPDGNFLASASGDRTLKLWEIASGTEIKTFRGHLSYIYSVDFSPDGKLLASSDFDGNIKLWDVTSGKELKNLKGHTDLVEPVRFSNHGCLLASGSFDSNINIWGIPNSICSSVSEAEILVDSNLLQLTNNGAQNESPTEQPAGTEAGSTNTWIKLFEGPDYGAFFDVILTQDGNVLTVGTTNHLHVPPYSGNALFMKLTLEGDVLWERVWGGEGYEQAWAVTQAVEGGYYVFGETDSYGAGDRDFFLLKMDEEGTEVWFRTYGRAYREWPYGMLPLSNGDLLIYGFTESVSGGERNQYAVRVTADGDVIWEYLGDSSDEELVANAIETTQGDLVLVVIVADDGKLVKLDSGGNIQWSKRYELSGWQFASQIVQMDNGGFFLAGFLMSSNRQADTWLAHCTSTGDLEWETSFGEPTFDDYAQSLIPLKDGTYLIGGIANGMLLSRVDVDGNVLWRRSLVGKKVYGAEKIIELEDGGYLITGFVQLVNGRSYDAIILRTDADGWVEE
jgi:WD40 repeat protein